MVKDAFLEKLGENIARLREKAGYTQLEFAQEWDKDKQALNRLEKGRTNPTAKTLKTIADILEIDVSFLLKFPDDKK